MTLDRRHFLCTAAAAAAAAAIAPRAYAASTAKPRRVGLIGSGWYGKCDVLRLIQVEPVDVVSICDVDQQMLAGAAEIIASRQATKKPPRTFTDYRQMLAEKDLDLVLVATPDHWHALPMIAAVEAGADVYCQKPTSVDVVESRAMLAAARRTGRVVQIGTQRRSTPHLIEARDRVIREGLLGDVGLIELCCYYHMRANENPPDSTPPASFDYEMWTGPAPMRPYNKLVHPRSWRAFTEYSNGIMGDMCVHMLDMVRWMLDLGWPERISSNGGIYVQTASKANIPDTQTATFQYGDLPIIWQHRSWGAAPDPEYPWAAVLYGSKGTLKASVNKYEFIPEGNGQRLSGEAVFEYDKYPEDRDEQDLERHVASAIRGHMRDWLTAVDQRSQPVADIEQGHISTTSCILANLSMDLGRSLQWDPVKQEVVGDPEANTRLRRAYRTPWVHPEP
jgi:predicted dehydrogenase